MLQKLAQCKTIDCKDLLINQPYLIKEIKSINTKFGKSVLVMLEDEDNVFRVFLPKIFNHLDEETITALNLEKPFLIYRGIVDKEYKFDFEENKKNNENKENDSE